MQNAAQTTVIRFDDGRTYTLQDFCDYVWRMFAFLETRPGFKIKTHHERDFTLTKYELLLNGTRFGPMLMFSQSKQQWMDVTLSHDMPFQIVAEDHELSLASI